MLEKRRIRGTTNWPFRTIKEQVQPDPKRQETCKYKGFFILFFCFPQLRSLKEVHRAIWTWQHRASTKKDLTTGNAANANRLQNPTVTPTGLLSKQLTNRENRSHHEMGLLLFILDHGRAHIFCCDLCWPAVMNTRVMICSFFLLLGAA